LDIADGEYSTANLTLIAADNKFLIKKITENALTYADRFEFAFTVPSDGDYTLTCFADDAYTVAYDSDGDGENETTTSAHQIYILNNGSAIDGATVRLSNSIRNTYTYSLIAGVTYTLRLMVSSTEVANLFYSENSGIEIAFKLQLEKGRTATEWEDPRKESKYRIPYPVTKEGFEAAVNDLKALIGASVNGLTDVNSVDSEYADVDNVPANKIIRYSTSNLFNTPDGKSGTLVSLAYDKSVENGKIHIFIASDNTLYYRICWKSAWKPWVDTSKHEISLSFDDGALISGGMLSDTNKYSTMADIPSNSIFTLITTGFTDIPEAVTGTVVTLGQAPGAGKNGAVQIYVTRVRNVYLRICWSGSYTQWNRLVSYSDITKEINTVETRRDYYACFSLFETIGVLGDSYASGSFSEDGQATSVAHYNLSWPQILGRRNGVEVTNYTKGGIDTANWLTNTTYGLPKLVSDKPRGLYILALGRNDTKLGVEYIGSVDALTGEYVDYPDTFCGNYGRIIEQIQEHAPNAKLVMLTCGYTNEGQIEFDIAIKMIATHYGLPCMDAVDDDYFTSEYYLLGRYRGDNHPMPIQYAGMELAIERLFNKCVCDYKDYFTFYYGTESDLTIAANELEATLNGE
ncbi:MAG: SGNH/GDSL hydrolase family protein, partial [Clostridia bacterium]|nr:SGNH/GDSL hydrolase family protein [Clostridia bacterium]